MANVPSSIGYLTVDGTVLRGLADSSDGGNEPDALPAAGTVTFTPGAPQGLSAVAEGVLLVLDTVKCVLNASGQIVPPTDGIDAGLGAGATPGVRLVAPNQAALSHVGWSWTATFTPAAGQPWSAFSIVFTGVPTDAVNLAEAALIAASSTLTQQPVVWVQDGTTIPGAARAGQFLYDQLTTTLYLIGA